jgi:4-aminobutyrate aminotransferase
VDVRGLGLMLALELATPEAAEALEHEAFRRGLLVLGCGHKSVRLSPPLVIDEATMASGLDVLAQAVAAVATR